MTWLNVNWYNFMQYAYDELLKPAGQQNKLYKTVNDYYFLTEKVSTKIKYP